MRRRSRRLRTSAAVDRGSTSAGTDDDWTLSVRCGRNRVGNPMMVDPHHVTGCIKVQHGHSGDVADDVGGIAKQRLQVHSLAGGGGGGAFATSTTCCNWPPVTTAVRRLRPSSLAMTPAQRAMMNCTLRDRRGSTNQLEPRSRSGPRSPRQQLMDRRPGQRGAARAPRRSSSRRTVAGDVGRIDVDVGDRADNRPTLTDQYVVAGPRARRGRSRMSSKLVVPAVTFRDWSEFVDTDVFRSGATSVDRALDRFHGRLIEHAPLLEPGLVAAFDLVFGDRGDVHEIDISGGAISGDHHLALDERVPRCPSRPACSCSSAAGRSRGRRLAGFQEVVRVLEALEVERVVEGLDRGGWARVGHPALTA